MASCPTHSMNAEQHCDALTKLQKEVDDLKKQLKALKGELAEETDCCPECLEPTHPKFGCGC